jgi:predicted O-methyltransferase YrrM
MKVIDTRDNMLSLIPKGLKIAELGVFKGYFAEKILEHCDPIELYLVDIFSGECGSGDKDGINHEHANMHEEMLKLTEKYESNDKVKIVKSTISQYLEKLEENSLDMVYIDADHSFDAVYSDLINSFRAVKPGGLICGHDYIYEAKSAIDAFCENYNQTIDVLTEDGCPSFIIINKK